MLEAGLTLLFLALLGAALISGLRAAMLKGDKALVEQILANVRASRDQAMDARAKLSNEVGRLLSAIRQHRDERGDDRCHADDGRLYAVLPEGDTRPEREVAVTIENCQKFIECRQTGREYVSPQRRIEELEDQVETMANALRVLTGNVACLDEVKRIARQGLSAIECQPPDRQKRIEELEAELKKLGEALTVEARINIEQTKQRDELRKFAGQQKAYADCTVEVNEQQKRRIAELEGELSYLKRKIANVRNALIDANSA